jgi:hypothetical protein
MKPYHPNIVRRCAFTSFLLFTAGLAVVRGQTFIDPGFESYAVNSGAFLQPSSGVWLFANDAGVVRPFAPNSSTGPLNTWSATFAPMEGQQYASTYAGADFLRQTLSFGAAGDYRLSVYAAAPGGTITIPSLGTFTLGNGEFAFTLGNLAISSPHTVSAGASWSLFTVDFNIAAPGDYQLGVRNTAASPYFINYDAFAIHAVPEPSVGVLGLLGCACILAARRRRTRQERV